MRKTAHSGTVTCGTCHGEEFVIKLEREKTVLVCTSCGWEGRVAVRGGWRRCPDCREKTVNLAAVCPKCGKVMPFLDDGLYLQDSVHAMSEHAAEVLPTCPECEVQAVPKWMASPKIIRAGE